MVAMESSEPSNDDNVRVTFEDNSNFEEDINDKMGDSAELIHLEDNDRAERCTEYSDAKGRSRRTNKACQEKIWPGD